MECLYYYKGKLIGNELQLNDFLIERRKFHTKYGDVVFQRSNKANEVIRVIDESIIPESGTWKFKMDEMWRNGGRLYDDDGEKVVVYDRQHPPFIGVNKYVDRFGADSGERLNAEFIPEEYWTRMFDRWTRGQFTTDNQNNPNEIIDIIKQVTGDDPTTIPGPLTQDTMDTWRKAIESKWKAQGEIGTAVHAVSEFYFSKTGDSYNFESIDNDVDAAWNNFPNEHKSNVSKETFLKAITMCQKLRDDMRRQYGPECVFYPEIAMTCETQVEVSGSKRIYGIIDLLVVDEHGIPHLLDFKTSTKPFSDFHVTKQKAYTYQLAIYERILANYGIRTDESTSWIIPIQIKDMNYDQATSKWNYDTISYNMIQSSDEVQKENLTHKVKSESVISNINKFLPSSVKLSLQTENLMENVTKSLKVLFPKYQIQRGSTDAELSERLREAGAFEIDPKYGDYRYRFPFGEDIVVSATDPNPESTMLRKVRAEIDSWTVKKQNLVGRVKNELKAAVTEGRSFKFRDTYQTEGDPLWLEQTMSQYCTEDWEVVDCPGAESFGMLLLQNVNTGLVTVLKLTNSQDLTYQHKFEGKGRKNLSGKYEEDVVENSKSDSRMLKALQGNIELMEAMIVLQNTHLASDANLNIQEFKLINPYTQSSLPASNREIMYSFNKLMNLAKSHGEDMNLDTSNFTGENPRIALVKPMELIRIQLKDVLRRHTDKHRVLNDYTIKAINDFMDATEVIDPDGLYKELYKLMQKWESENGYKDAVSTVRTNVKDVLSPEYKLYSDIMIAMADLKNLDVRQQIKDADKWLESVNIARDGMEGLYTENPGNFKSQTLNQITSAVSNVYQKVKDSMNRRNAKLRQLVKKLKEEKNYGYVKNNLSGNPTSLYENMIEERNGDLVFVNPDTLHGAEKEFLEYILEVINENRHPNEKANFETWKRNGDLRYYRVPLMRASDASKMSTSGNLKALGDRMRTWTVKGAMQELKEKTQGFLSPEEEALAYAKQNIFNMNNVFDWSESDKRLDKIQENGGVNAFEHNLEDLVLHHCFAYDLSKEMNKEMPMIKASAIALAVQGVTQNDEHSADGFKNIQEFIEDYVKSKVKGQSINDPKYRKLEGAVGKVRQVASFMSLAFSPVQFTYQMVEHIWKSIGLVIRKPDGTDAFTAKNMFTSLKHVYRQLTHFSDDPSELQLLNETYGINDMDSKQFADRISSNQGFLTNFEDWAFRMASRADFYSRMSIFEAQMRKDGSLEAHTKVDGKLVYDYKKDKRYEAMFTHPQGSQEYNEAYARYLIAAKQFQEEGVLNEDGTEFKIGDALPRAYTNKEASSMKAIADNVYGYYNNETKSMMGSMLLGGLFTQMKTYWSAKKNQYLAPGGVKLIGHFEDYKEKDANGEMKQMYYQKTETGEIDINAPFVFEDDPKCSKVKVQRWKGQWQEGIMATLWKLGAGAVDGRFSEEWDELWNNPDENLRIAYRSNIKQLAYDLLMLCVIGNLTSYVLGDWADDEEDEWRKDKGDAGKATDYMMANFIYKTFDNSFRDFNMIASIWDPMLDWQPFAFNTLWKNTSRMWNAAIGDEDFSRSVLTSFSAGRLVSPLYDSLTFEETV